MLCELNSQLLHFRKCPVAENRKMLEKVLKEAWKARRGSDIAEAGAHGGGSIDGNPDHICWFCHEDVTNMEMNKCAGCRKVTPSFTNL